MQDKIKIQELSELRPYCEKYCNDLQKLIESFHSNQITAGEFYMESLRIDREYRLTIRKYRKIFKKIGLQD